MLPELSPESSADEFDEYTPDELCEARKHHKTLINRNKAARARARQKAALQHLQTSVKQLETEVNCLANKLESAKARYQQLVLQNLQLGGDHVTNASSSDGALVLSLPVVSPGLPSSDDGPQPASHIKAEPLEHNTPEVVVTASTHTASGCKQPRQQLRNSRSGNGSKVGSPLSSPANALDATRQPLAAASDLTQPAATALPTESPCARVSGVKRELCAVPYGLVGPQPHPSGYARHSKRRQQATAVTAAPAPSADLRPDSAGLMSSCGLHHSVAAAGDLYRNSHTHHTKVAVAAAGGPCVPAARQYLLPAAHGTKQASHTTPGASIASSHPHHPGHHRSKSSSCSQQVPWLPVPSGAMPWPAAPRFLATATHISRAASTGCNNAYGWPGDVQGELELELGVVPPHPEEMQQRYGHSQCCGVHPAELQPRHQMQQKVQADWPLCEEFTGARPPEDFCADRQHQLGQSTAAPDIPIQQGPEETQEAGTAAISGNVVNDVPVADIPCWFMEVPNSPVDVHNFELADLWNGLSSPTELSMPKSLAHGSNSEPNAAAGLVAGMEPSKTSQQQHCGSPIACVQHSPGAPILPPLSAASQQQANAGHTRQSVK